ncbi:hypothetical protein Nepgr_016218 [Nepenthes gracilis]|uniref:Oleosin n=1 Tax=Nepenthes gracilis TaxID=150966 RepID=A0AAD3SNT4_NEPGR|nr:hypothetical protein Nepgr_016218 [Nepenthes gracilis]
MFPMQLNTCAPCTLHSLLFKYSDPRTCFFHPFDDPSYPSSPPLRDPMADRDRPLHQLQVHPQKGGQAAGPSASQAIAVITLLPVSGTLLALAGITLVLSLIGLAVATPLFLIFSPVLVPAAILVGLAVAAFVASGAMGLTGLSSLSKVAEYLRGTVGRSVPEQMEFAKRRMQDMAGYAGQKTKETGQTIQGKAQEGGKT